MLSMGFFHEIQITDNKVFHAPPTMCSRSSEVMAWDQAMIVVQVRQKDGRRSHTLCACSGWAEMSRVGLGSRIKCLCLCEEECSNNLKLQSWTVPGGRCSLVLVLQQFVSKRVTWRWKRHHSVHKLSTVRASVCAEWNQVKLSSQLQYNLKQF